MDLKQFKTNIIPLREKLLSYSLNILENRDDAEDTVQEAFLKLWNIREQLDNYTNVGGLAMQTTKNICIDKLRTRKFSVEPEDFQIGFNSQTPYSELEKKDSIDLVRKIMNELPELQKRIMTMRDIDGYELAEIAQITGTQISAVTMNLSRARKKVRERFLLINAYKQKINQQ